MGIVAMKAMAGGVSRVGRGDRLYGADPQELRKRLSQKGVPVAAIKWALRNQSVDTAIVCMTDHDQFDENLRAMAEPYTQKDEQVLRPQWPSIGPNVLPHVRRLQRRLRQGRSGSGHAAVPDLCAKATASSPWPGSASWNCLKRCAPSGAATVLHAPSRAPMVWRCESG